MTSRQSESVAHQGGEARGQEKEAKGSTSLSRAERRRLEREGATPRKAAERPRRSGGTAPTSGPGFGLRNAILGGAGLLAVGLGFLLLSQGSITLAPILLVIGYGVLLPLALFL